MSPMAEVQRPDGKPTWAQVVTAVPVLLAAVGLVIYAHAWSAHAGFYGEFELAPSTAGLDYSTVVTQAGVALVFIAGIFGVTGLAGILLALAIDPKVAAFTPGGFYKSSSWQRSFSLSRRKPASNRRN